MIERGEAGCQIDKTSRIESTRLRVIVERREYGPIWPDVVKEPIEKRRRDGELHQIDVV